MSVFLLLVGVGPGLGRMGLRFGSVIWLPVRKTLDMCWWAGVLRAFGVLSWLTLGAVCVGEFGGVFWLKILLRFARGDGGRAVMPLFRVWFCGVSIGFALDGGVW